MAGVQVTSIRAMQHVHHQANQHFFLLRVGLSHQQGERGQTGIVDDRLAVGIEQAAVAI